jgi:hypothetical protein
MALRPVNDPELLAQLSAEATPQRKPVSDPALLAQLDAKPEEPKTDWLRQIALGGRAIGEGVFGAFAAPKDIEIVTRNLMKKGLNKLGTNFEMEPTASQKFSQALTDAGAYEPETSGEQYASAATRGVSGALTGGLGLLGMAGKTMSAPNVVRTGVAGATGGVASEGARQAGFGPGVQFLAGLAGGFTPYTIEELARLGTRTAGNIVRPMTRSGQEQMAGNIMANQATDRGAAAWNLQTAKPVVPGSNRTAGEASGDIGLLALEKGVRGKNPAPFGQRLSEQNAARQAELSAIAGTEADLAAAQSARHAATAPMREKALNSANAATSKFQSLAETIENRFRSKASALQDKGRFDTHHAQMQNVADHPYLAVSGHARVPGRLSPHSDRAREAASASADVAPVVAQRQAELKAAQNELAQLKASGASPLEVQKITRRIDGILRTPGMRASQVVEKSMESIRDRLQKIAREDGTIDARDLYTVRKELGNYIQSAAKESASWDKRLTSGLQVELQHSIDDAIEASAPGFKAYLERYKELSKPIDQMKVLQEIQRRSQLSSADITTGQEFLGAGRFDQALKAAMQKSGQKLTPDQIQRLNAIRTDLQYGQAINGPLVKAPGSDTFQNLSIAQVLGAGNTSAHPLLRVLTKPLDWVYKLGGTDEKVIDILTEAMLDPKLAGQMLMKATPQSVQKFSDALRVRTYAATSGASLSAMQSPPQGNSSTTRQPQ